MLDQLQTVFSVAGVIMFIMWSAMKIWYYFKNNILGKILNLRKWSVSVNHATEVEDNEFKVLTDFSLHWGKYKCHGSAPIDPAEKETIKENGFLVEFTHMDTRDIAYLFPTSDQFVNEIDVVTSDDIEQVFESKYECSKCKTVFRNDARMRSGESYKHVTYSIGTYSVTFTRKEDFTQKICKDCRLEVYQKIAHNDLSPVDSSSIVTSIL